VRLVRSRLVCAKVRSIRAAPNPYASGGLIHARLAERGRRRRPASLATAQSRGYSTDPEHEAFVDAFLAAARDGDFGALLEVLDPDVVLRADLGPLPTGGSREVRGAAAVAGQALTYSRLGLFVRPALINGAVGAVTTRDGQPFSVGGFTIRGRRIVEMDILADPRRLRQLDLTILDS